MEIEKSKNNKNSILTIVMLLIILLLCGVITYLAFNFGKELGNNNESDIVDKKEEENKIEEKNKIEELNINASEVQKIIKKFKLEDEYGSGIISSYYETYSNVNLSIDRLYYLTRENSKDLFTIENNCSPGYSIDEEGNGYRCRYISYSKFNNEYNKLTGKNLPKEDIKFELYILKYDAQTDVYTEYFNEGYGSGGDPRSLSKILKAQKEGEYIYIYQKVGYLIFPDSNDENNLLLTTPSKYKNIHFSSELSEYVEILNEQLYLHAEDAYDYDKIIKDYLNKFETYKWTFKKNDNGEYVYDSLTLVTE